MNGKSIFSTLEDEDDKDELLLELIELDDNDETLDCDDPLPLLADDELSINVFSLIPARDFVVGHGTCRSVLPLSRPAAGDHRGFSRCCSGVGQRPAGFRRQSSCRYQLTLC